MKPHITHRTSASGNGYWQCMYRGYYRSAGWGYKIQDAYNMHVEIQKRNDASDKAYYGLAV